MSDNFLMSKSDVIPEYFMKGASNKWIFQWGIWRFPFLVKLVFPILTSQPLQHNSVLRTDVSQNCGQWAQLIFATIGGMFFYGSGFQSVTLERVLQMVNSRIQTAGGKGVWENLVIHGRRHSTPTAWGMNTSVLTHEAFNPYRRAMGSSIKQCAPNISWELLLQPRDISEVV